MKKEQQPAKVKVMRSTSGLGLFAMEPIKKGKFIIEYVGDIYTAEEGDNLNNLYIFNVSKKKDIDGSPRWNTARYINHSCRPNAEAEIKKDRVFINAKRNIMLGEELTYDYGKEYWNEYIKPYGCRCAKCVEKRAQSGVTKKKASTTAKKTTKKTGK
ncbi:MAG: hypothetical protein A2494_02805 [Candidatus Lloydbacteria bacterium RIFOXYC12_FULL_46_25]|uniref:SET domain-containing protein n=1 Tax=Candidatus Lloydbacteria bacterium RIFOXYC12_FULL_46_25 TaxID=1798670 RepID=A0A1G2E3K1_9BACT|nr:MAG: hypothetical protein A2494_02805 [Candidatus Lloydbacteria bacterium RIFOXYC12_FULL_46_25]